MKRLREAAGCGPTDAIIQTENTGGKVTLELYDADDEFPDIQIGDIDPRNIKVGSYVLVKFSSQHRSVFYVGKVSMSPAHVNNDVLIDFMRKRHKMENKFVFSPVSDSHFVESGDICAILPKPLSKGTTSRTKDCAVFPVSFTSLNKG